MPFMQREACKPILSLIICHTVGHTTVWIVCGTEMKFPLSGVLHVRETLSFISRDPGLASYTHAVIMSFGPNREVCVCST